MYPLVEDMSEMNAYLLPRVYAIFLFAIECSAKAKTPQHLTLGTSAVWGGVARHTAGARTPLLLCGEEIESRLTTQWQTETYHILLAEDWHIFLTSFLKICCVHVATS